MARVEYNKNVYLESMEKFNLVQPLKFEQCCGRIAEEILVDEKKIISNLLKEYVEMSQEFSGLRFRGDYRNFLIFLTNILK